MKNLNIVKIENDVTIFESGESFISQRKLAELIGVNQSSIQRFCASQNLDVKQGLSEENVNLCITHYALDSKHPTQKAKDLLRKVTQAGIRVFLHHLAGYAFKATKKPMTHIQMIAELAQDMVRQEHELLATKQTADSALSLAEKHDHIIENNKSQEVKPPKGYYSIKTLETAFAYKFPKAHIRGIINDPNTKHRIRVAKCKKYIEATLSFEEYLTYNKLDIGLVIKDLISTRVRVIKADGKPSVKVRSPLYGQPFKYPV
jgi:hypothetical protein